MMLLSPKFVWFQYADQWSILLALKQGIFILMLIYAFGYARMICQTGAAGTDTAGELYRHRVEQFRKISIALGITAVLLGAAMNIQ